MEQVSPTTAVLLAAGAGTRLGRGPKALLPRDGGPLVDHLTQVLRDGGCSGVVVVLGAEADRVREEAALEGCTLVLNDGWDSGMGGSLVQGLAAVPEGNNALVALVDQPGLNARTVRAVLSGHFPGHATAAAYPDADGALRRGHPVLFDATMLAQVAGSAEGDEGARRFLQAHPGLLNLVDCGAWGDGRDVDTEEDLPLLDA